MMVKRWNRYAGTVKQRWWNSGTMMVEHWNGDGETEEQRQCGTVKKRDGETVELIWNSDGGTEE